MSRVLNLAILAVSLGGGCRRAPLPRAAQAAPASAASRGAAQTASPRLDESGPRVDLLASRALWHLFQRGLVIPFASEGFRKYTQEYTSPWRGVTKLQDRAGRVLGTATSSLRFPWDGEAGAATIVVRMNGATGQRLSLRLNGKQLKTATVASGWQTLSISAPAGVLRPGENDLVIAVAKKGALFYSLEVIAGPPPEPADAWPASSPVIAASVAGQERAALAGFRRYSMLLEIPRQSFLLLETAAAQMAAHLRVSARPEGQPAQILLDETQQPGQWQPHTLSLAARV
jgi:hypothetical protein